MCSLTCRAFAPHIHIEWKWRLGLNIRSLAPLDSHTLSNSYTMVCPPVHGDSPQALASGLSYVQVDTHGITSLYHLHQ